MKREASSVMTRHVRLSTEVEPQNQCVILMTSRDKARFRIGSSMGNKQQRCRDSFGGHELRTEQRVGLRAVTKCQDLPIWDSLVCEYRLLSLPSSTQPTIHSAPSLTFARSILSQPLASRSRLQTSSRHLARYHLCTSSTFKLALIQKTWRLQAHLHPPPRAATHPRLRAPMPPGTGTSTLAFPSFAGHEAREAQTHPVCKRLTRRDL